MMPTSTKLSAVQNEEQGVAGYRGWHIARGRWPEPSWVAVHPDYDASYEGAEDGWVDNGLKANGSTYDALCEEIDAVCEERGL